MATAAATAGVSIVTGDTEVVQKGKADGCFINTTGIGVIERDLRLGATLVKPGDAVIVSGPIGDHGVTIMLARGELDLVSDIASDTAPLTNLVDRLCDATTAVGCLLMPPEAGSPPSSTKWHEPHEWRWSLTNGRFPCATKSEELVRSWESTLCTSRVKGG